MGPRGSSSSRSSIRIPGMRFRQPHEAVDCFVLEKIFALTEINNNMQTFTIRKGEEVAVSITEDEYKRFLLSPQDFKPDHWLDMFAYNGTSVEWEDPLITTDGCEFLIREHEGQALCWRQRMCTQTFNEPYELENFPFDVQELTMVFQTHSYSNDKTKFILHPWAGGTGYSGKFVEPQGEFTTFKDLAHFQIDGSQVVCTYKVQRNWPFYFWKVMFVLGVLSLSTACTFISEGYDDAMAFLATIFLTVVAFLYIVGTYMPVLKYLTLLDKYIFAQVIFLFGNIVTVSVFEITDNWPYLRANRLMLVSIVAGVWFVGHSVFALVCWRAWHIEVKKLKPMVEVATVAVAMPAPMETGGVKNDAVN